MEKERSLEILKKLINNTRERYGNKSLQTLLSPLNLTVEEIKELNLDPSPKHILNYKFEALVGFQNPSEYLFVNPCDTVAELCLWDENADGDPVVVINEIYCCKPASVKDKNNKIYSNLKDAPAYIKSAIIRFPDMWEKISGAKLVSAPVLTKRYNVFVNKNPFEEDSLKFETYEFFTFDYLSDDLAIKNLLEKTVDFSRYVKCNY